eukprot:3061792-Pyramimonas_sp.AAC.1
MTVSFRLSTHEKPSKKRKRFLSAALNPHTGKEQAQLPALIACSHRVYRGIGNCSHLTSAGICESHCETAEWGQRNLWCPWIMLDGPGELPTDSSLPTKPCVPEDVKEQKVGAASPSDATLESPSKRQHIEVGS